MINVKISAEHGFIDGIYNQSNGKDLAIIINGLNGFCTYGMFPFIQEELANNGISSIAFNFSHGGVRGVNDTFTELDLYEKNSMRLETLDILSVHKYVNTKMEFDRLFLISHSLGSIPAVFAAKSILENQINRLAGVILIAPSMNLDFWGDENMKKWKEQGYLINKNKRTNQELRLGLEYYNETKESDTTWSLETCLLKTSTRFLIIHGENDESIPIEEAEQVNYWNNKAGNQSELIVIPNANHNFNVTHLEKNKTKEFLELTSYIVKWIKVE